MGAFLPGRVNVVTLAAAAIALLSRAYGPTAGGGGTITIYGSGFTGATGVTIGGAACTSVSVADDNTITCVAPAGTSGAKDVVVAGLGGNGTKASGYTYQAGPDLASASLDVTSCGYGGGVLVTVTGAARVEVGATMTLGGVAHPMTRLSSTSFSFIAKAIAIGSIGAKDLVVTNPDTQTGTKASAFTYTAQTTPAISSLSRAYGPTAGGGAAISIYGGGLTGTTGVTIGGASATSVTVVSDTEVTCVPPAGSSGARDVVLTNAVGSVTKSSGYTYQSGPSLSGASLDITTCGYQGGKYIHVTGAARVEVGATGTLGGTAILINRVSSTEFYFRVPEFAFGSVGAKALVVTNPDTQSDTKNSAVTITTATAPRYTDGATMDAAVAVGQIVELVGATTGARIALLECGQLSPVKYYNAGGTVDVYQADSNQFTGVIAFAALGTGAVPDWSSSTAGNANTGGPKFSSTAGTFVLNGFMSFNAIRRPYIRCAGYMDARYGSTTNDFIGIGFNSAADSTKVCIAGIGKTASGHANGALTDAAVNSFTPSFNSNYGNPPDEDERWDLACTVHPYNGAPPAGAQTTGGGNNDGQGALDGSSNVASSVHAVATDLRPAFYSKNPGTYHINQIFFVNKV